MIRQLLWIILLTPYLLQAYTLKGHIVQEQVWRAGETFLSFLHQNKMPLKLYYKLDPEDEKLLMDIRMATTYYIVRDENGQVLQVLLPLSEELQLHISRDLSGKYQFEVIPIIYKTIRKHLVMAFAGIPSKDITKRCGNFDVAIEVEQLFKKVIDFRKIRKGDHLVVLYDEKMRLGKPFGDPIIEAAMIEVRGKPYYRFLALDGRYYDQNGKNAKKSSFIVPCHYNHISSVFTNKRWHPILHRYRAHHGIDYATPVGTPIKAAYNGKVIFAGKKGGYGNVVIIRHPGGYKTFYAHLSRFKTHVGKQVKTGELIALSGNTGMSTGPHLHFGLSRNGRWINPALQITFQGGLRGEKRRAFLQSVKIYLQKIKNLLQSQNKREKDQVSLETIEDRNISDSSDKGGV